MEQEGLEQACSDGTALLQTLVATTTTPSVRGLPTTINSLHARGHSNHILTFSSSRAIHDAARWQFWRHTQSPVPAACLMTLSASGPWPWPRLMRCRRLPSAQPLSSPKRWSVAVGSAPGGGYSERGLMLNFSAPVCVFTGYTGSPQVFKIAVCNLLPAHQWRG
jgi:hypothetical protein